MPLIHDSRGQYACRMCAGATGSMRAKCVLEPRDTVLSALWTYEGFIKIRASVSIFSAVQKIY